MIELIQPFLAPTVMISAGSLICLAQFARFTTVIAHLRDLQRESLAMVREAGDGLENQSNRVLAHVAILRNALIL